MLTDKDTKLTKALEVSEEILENIELGNITFEQVLLKCKKLARLRDDFEAIDWFSAEISGYGNKIISHLSGAVLEEFAKKSGRHFKQIGLESGKEEIKYWILSISEIEMEIKTKLIELENLKPPTSFTPATSKYSSENRTFGASSGEHVVEKYQDVLTAFKVATNALSITIGDRKSLLSKIKNNIYNYVLNINLQLRFENVTESIFQEAKIIVDKKLIEVCPTAMKKFLTAIERLKSNNPEEWSQAMSSCRNVLKEFADVVFAARKDKFKKSSGEEIDVTDDKYKNRLIAFIDSSSKGDKRKFLETRTAELESRIHILNDLLSKGTHVGLELNDVRICLIDTYLLIGSLINLIPQK